MHCKSISRRIALAHVVLAGLSTATLSAAAVAQDFPTAPITIIVPFSPGGPDRALRLVVDKMQASLKQPVIIDYKPGATGLIGATFVQKAKPDGYTLLFSSNSGLVVAPLLRQPVPFEVSNDFVPVSMIMRYSMFFAVPPNFPANSVADFVALAKAKADTMNYGSPGIGSVAQLSSESFARAAGIKMTHVPYKGIGDTQTALMSNDIQLFLDGPLSSGELVRAAKVKPLAVTGDKRIPAFPNVPTMKEAGYPGVNGQVWVGVFAPKGTPDAIVRRLSEEIARAVNSPDVREQISQGGLADPVGGTPAQLMQTIEAETPGFAKLVKELDLRVQ